MQILLPMCLKDAFMSILLMTGRLVLLSMTTAVTSR